MLYWTCHVAPAQAKPSRIAAQTGNDGLRTAICCLRREIEDKQGAVGRHEILLRERPQRIDELNGKIDQLRDQNKRLDTEAERLAEMVRLSPPAVAS